MQQRAAAADEPDDMNFIRRHATAMSSEGLSNSTARLFSNPAGDYGSMVNERVGAGNWESGEELGDTWASRNAYSYGRYAAAGPLHIWLVALYCYQRPPSMRVARYGWQPAQYPIGLRMLNRTCNSQTLDLGFRCRNTEVDLPSSQPCLGRRRGQERGVARPEVLQALLKSTDRVVQEVDSVEYGLTDIQACAEQCRRPCSAHWVSYQRAGLIERC